MVGDEGVPAVEEDRHLVVPHGRRVAVHADHGEMRRGRAHYNKKYIYLFFAT